MQHWDVVVAYILHTHAMSCEVTAQRGMPASRDPAAGDNGGNLHQGCLPCQLQVVRVWAAQGLDTAVAALV